MNEWIGHKGKEMPAAEETLVDVKLWDGRKIFRVNFWKPSNCSLPAYAVRKVSA